MTGFTRLTFDRLFVPDRGFALARPLLLVMSVPLWVSAQPSRRTTATPRRPTGAGGGEELGVSIWSDRTSALHWPPLTLCLQTMSSVKLAILLLICGQRDHSWIAR